MRTYGMSKDEAAGLQKGEPVEFHDGRQWVSAEVREPLRDVGSHKGLTVRVSNGTYETEAAPGELRP